MSGTTTTTTAATGPPEITAEWTVHAQLTLSSSTGQQQRRTGDGAPAANNDGGTTEEAPDRPGTVDGGTQKEGDINSSPQRHGATAAAAASTSSGSNPVKVVYKFSTSSVDSQQPTTTTGGSSTTIPMTVSSPSTVGKSNVIFNTDPSSAAPLPPTVCIQSPTGDDGPAPPGTATEPAQAQQQFPKCTSTCSIVLTACTDLLPLADTIPILINQCGSTSNVVADKGTNFPEKSNTNDVSCQTSDWETHQSSAANEATGGGSIRRRTKAITDGHLLSPPPTRRADERPFDSSLVRKSPVSPSAAAAYPVLSPSNTIRSQQSVASVSAAKKKPRTVHIDVYCTGSDAESSSSCSDVDCKSLSSHSSCSSGSRFDTSHMMELKSSNAAAAQNPTDTQSIFESDEMKVRHKRAGKHDVPRRLMQQPIDQNTLSTIGSLRKGDDPRPASGGRHRRSATNDEITESKQILFSKHLGDMSRVAKVEDLSAYFRRDASDDAISSNYAMSNLSTRRDVTGSSLSSALQCGVGDDDEEDDLLDAEAAAAGRGPTVRLNRSGTNATHSDSFEYENSEDRFRIHEMERVWNLQKWKSPSVERKLLLLHNPPRRHSSSPRDPAAVHRRTSLLLRSDSEHNLSESDHSFVYDTAEGPPTATATEEAAALLLRAHESNPSLNELSDSSPSTVKSASQRVPASGAARGTAMLQQAAVLAATLQREFSPVEGYTNEYLAIARRFGSLIKGRRKPGTHMGPVRNPECPCAHCRRWVVERRDSVAPGGGGTVGSGLRERALSVDETAPNNIVEMRRQFHMRNLF
ncbi:uncharacterized protein LOC128268219 [Anopheles cruzii]|uniref:uncharacterized protein LOC128268219 n=1 Tax=Anopheles cruzii TaxID=68878 RepID=UPI0022EC3A15|nr:uncharacterized protein LOC128268219 [Anopheles cruzii]